MQPTLLVSLIALGNAMLHPAAPVVRLPDAPVVRVAPMPRATPRLPRVASADATQGNDSDALIARAQKAWARITTLRATFEQTVTNPLTGSSMQSRGELQQRKPDRLSIAFVQPAGDRIVADGHYVWLYLPSTTPGQVFRTSVSDAMTANTDLLGQFLVTPRARYDVASAGTDSVSGRSTRVLVLTAKPGQALPFVRAKVWLDSDAVLRQFEATDANGITRRVRLLTFLPNARVESSVFSFSVPAGVRVVDR
jgi:outer membrane lipoprotein carrier protein